MTAVAQQLIVEQETAAEDVRNALQILRVSRVDAPLGCITFEREDVAAIDRRLSCAAEKADETEAKLTVAKQLIKDGVNNEQSLMRDLRQAQQRIAYLAKELVLARGSRAGAQNG